MMRTRLFALAFSLAAIARLQADPVLFSFAGDKLPSESPYAPWYTTVGPGHPTGQYFVGTSWSSDGNILTVNTIHPNDYPGATSLGIWFGRTDGYGDPSSGLNFANTDSGNRIDVRLALGANSSEWSIYWYDGSGKGASFYFLDNGFHFYTATDDVFVPSTSMTSFHTYSSHVFNGTVSYYLDDMLLGSGAAPNGPGNFLVFGDGSAGSVSGYGSLLVDSMDITVSAGAAPVPEPETNVLLGLGALVGILVHRGKRHSN
ncbi:MAG: hypothetical protein H7Y43_14435 [Akkermansiaceae bacterium]|nr:hypothetical protein [Verrucomicrobiales bacterium]